MLYSNQHQTRYLAELQILEDAHEKAKNKATENFLMEAMAVKKGDVVSVDPKPHNYFSSSNRFLILSVTAHVARDKATGHFAGVLPAVVGVFLRPNGDPVQSIRYDVKPGHLHTESLALKNSKWLKGPITEVADDQTHNVDLG